MLQYKKLKWILGFKVEKTERDRNVGLGFLGKYSYK